ncbi:MAG: 6-bladed beta-propeller [Gemmatimonadota bacterium]|nr:6-bladed beta-propeller [Gemmatimonadota bacterium]
MKRKPHLTDALVAGCLTVAAGCQAESAPASDLVYETRDSAGIPIAVNTGFPSPGDSWLVDPEPFLSIGGVSADPPAVFTVVTQAARLGDGRIVILESETSELRFFDGGGRHLRTAGGRGEGPGEFEYAADFVRLQGDTLLVDAGDRHILFSPSGDYVREKTIDVMGLHARDRAFCGPRSLLADGSLLLCELGQPDDGGHGGHRRAARIVRAANGGAEQRLGLFAGPDGGVLFSLGTLTASGGSPMSVAIVNNPEYSVELWSPDGELHRIIRRQDGRRPPTDREIEAALEMAMRLFGPAPPTPETPDLVPAAFGLTVGVRGDVWIRRAPLPGMRDATVFDVFDHEGRFRGEVRFDAYFWLYEVGDDYLLGARLDELDVPHIQLHRLRRGKT